MSIEGEEVQTKGIHNLFNKIITKNFPNLEKVLAIQTQEATRTPKLTKIELPDGISSLKQQEQTTEKEH
jgi:hypothetical protein